jgi:hypothetical protein
MPFAHHGSSCFTLEIDMKSSLQPAQFVRPTRNILDSVNDWDEAVRVAFVEGCLREGLRAEIAEEALREADTSVEPVLREQSQSATLSAAVAWLKLETCLARYGELAAMALARCLDEAELELRVRVSAVRPTKDTRDASDRVVEPSTPVSRSSGVVVRNTDAQELIIVQRGRERLHRFWANDNFRAA